MPTVHLVIKGKVQGVFYRATAREKAEEAGVKGWIKNTEAGHVEARVSGSREQLDRFIAWCHEGPPRAVVTEVEVTELPEEVFGEFRVVRG